MKNRTKILLAIGCILTIYGYLCRLLSIYFFWDSRAIGWVLILIGITFFLVDNMEARDEQAKNTVANKVGIGLLIFAGIALVGFNISTRIFSDVYDIATRYIADDQDLKREIGEVKGFGILTTGSIQVESNSYAEYGYAVFNFTLRGDYKYKDVTIELAKSPESPQWNVIQLE
jgi:hypothetical protein